MSYPPAKRQRSNTSRESANGTPQTAPPSLRHSHLAAGLSLYPSPGYENGGYPLQAAARQQISYNPYSPSAVTTPTGGYGGPYQTSTTGYGPGPYSPQQQANNFAAQYAAQSPPNGHMTYHNTNFQQQPRPNPATTTMQHQHQPTLADYAESYTPQPTAHAPPYHPNTNSYPDATVLNSHFSPAQMSSPAPIPSPAHLPTPAPQNGYRHTPEEEFGEMDEEEDAQGEMADESTEVRGCRSRQERGKMEYKVANICPRRRSTQTPNRREFLHLRLCLHRRSSLRAKADKRIIDARARRAAAIRNHANPACVASMGLAVLRLARAVTRAATSSPT